MLQSSTGLSHCGFSRARAVRLGDIVVVTGFVGETMVSLDFITFHSDLCLFLLYCSQKSSVAEADELNEEAEEVKEEFPDVKEDVLELREELSDSRDDLEESVEEKEVSIWKPKSN